MADNSAQNGTDTIATDELTTLNGGAVSGFKVQRVKVGFGADAVLTDVTSTDPLPVTIGQSATAADGSATGTTLAAAAQVIFDGGNYRVARAAYGDAQTPIVFQAAVPMLFDGTNVSRARAGSGVVGAGVQRVCLATDVALPAGTNLLGRTNHETNNSKVMVQFWATGAASGTTGTETAITLTRSGAPGAATTTGASFIPTTGKRLRILSIMVASRGHATATAQVTTFTVRVNTAGAVTTTSNALLAARVATPATALAWDRANLMQYDVGLDIVGDGTLQFGITANAVFVTNAPTWDVLITAVEYTA